jgi:hypothetical protein
MLGLRRKTRPSMAPEPSIAADLSGATVHGQVAVGENITQFHLEDGSVLNYIAPDKQPRPKLRQLPVRRLPRDFPGLLGREAELEDASLALASGSAVEVFGEAGIGKSSLLRYIAHHRAQQPSEGCVYHAYTGEPLDDLLQFFFESFYECETAFVPTPAQLTEYMQGRRALLILDDLDLERDELQRLMDAVPSCLFLTASTGQHLWGEGRAIELSGLSEEASLALIEAQLGRSLTGEEHHAIRSLSRSVRGHPLRLLQVGAEMRRGLTTARLAEITSAGPTALQGAVVASLSEEDRLLLRALAALPAGSLHSDDLAAVTGLSDAQSRLKALEEQRLVQSHSPRYSLAGVPETELLDERERHRWRECLLIYFASQVEAWRRGPGPASEAGSTMLALIEWGAAAKLWPEVLRLARGLDKSFALGGRWGSWRTELGLALSAARALEDLAAEAWSRHQLGSRALCLGETKSAKTYLTAALQLRQTLGDHKGARTTRHNLELLSTPPPAGHGPRGWLTSTTLLAALALALVTGTVAALLLTRSNNASPGPTTGRQSSQPDLVVSVDKTEEVGGPETPSCQVTYTLANTGGSDAGQSVTELSLSAAVGAPPISHVSRPLAAGQSREETVTAPQTTCPSKRDVNAAADSNDQVAESNEEDNKVGEAASPPTTSTETGASTTAPTTSSTVPTTTTSTTTDTIG